MYLKINNTYNNMSVKIKDQIYFDTLIKKRTKIEHEMILHYAHVKIVNEDCLNNLIHKREQINSKILVRIGQINKENDLNIWKTYVESKKML